MPTECISDLFGFARVEGRAVVASFDGGRVTSDGGALLLGRTARALGLIERFAGCFGDSRNRTRIEHEVTTLVGQRVYGIALGYEDLVDHDELRHDAVLAALGGKLSARRSDCAALAGKSTLNRLEHAPSGDPTRYHKIGHDGAAIERLFVDLFVEAHAAAPGSVRNIVCGQSVGNLTKGTTRCLSSQNILTSFWPATRSRRTCWARMACSSS